MGNKLARRRPQVDDRYTKPQGLYQHKDVDHKKLRRLIIESKLAPCYPGAEDAAVDLDECPICFLHYPSLNRSKCCTKGICTECFLQVKSPHSARPTQCPFCKTPSYAVEYKGAKTQEEKGVEQAEEQKVIEAKIRIRRQQEIQDEEARLRRQEDVPQERPASPLREGNEQNLVTAPAFPVFAGSTLADDRSLERMSAAERSWNNWTSVDRPAMGYPQPDFFTFPPVTADSESMWFRGGQGDPGVTRPNSLSSSSAITARNSASFNLRRAAWNNSSTGDISGQGPPTGSGYLQYNRDDDFDLDLEDIMVMEAIWLSIQEQGSQRPMENNSESLFPAPFSGHQCDNQEERIATLDSSDSRARRGSVTGGFASAIAALAERQVTGNAPLSETAQTDSESNDSAANSSRADGQGASDPPTIEEQIETESGLDSFLVNIQKGDGTDTDRPNAQSSGATGSISTSGSLTTWMREGSVETSSDALLDQSSEVVEVGTSFCSSIPSASELPWEAPEVGDGNPEPASCNPPVLESFEEQMMLAMALSLAEAQAKNGVNQASDQTQHE